MHRKRCLTIGLCGLLLWGGNLQAQSKKDSKGEINAPAAKGERLPDKLRVGDPAPDFTLPDPHCKKQTTLSSFKGKKPVVLVFASYT